MLTHRLSLELPLEPIPTPQSQVPTSPLLSAHSSPHPAAAILSAPSASGSTGPNPHPLNRPDSSFPSSDQPASLIPPISPPICCRAQGPRDLGPRRGGPEIRPLGRQDPRSQSPSATGSTGPIHLRLDSVSNPSTPQPQPPSPSAPFPVPNLSAHSA